jgi:hypothetical protein
LCQLTPEGGRLDEVDKRALPVDLHDGQPLAVALLEVGNARDVDLLELEPELVLELRQCRPRPVAEVAAGGAEQTYFRYG